MTTPNIHTQVADVLAAARGLIEERGWVQGLFRGPEGQICAREALNVACDRSLRRHLFDRFSTGALRDVIGTSFLGVCGWNDAPGRTKQEVLAAFETAEANERRRAEA